MKPKLIMLALLATLTAGCTGGGADDTALVPPPSPVLTWSAPAHYEFRMHSTCGERDLIGRFHVVVRNFRVRSVKGLDERGRTFLERDEVLRHIPTLDDLLKEADRARRRGAEVVEVDLDEEDLHPTRISIDDKMRVTDDEACYFIKAYKELVARSFKDDDDRLCDVARRFPGFAGVFFRGGRLVVNYAGPEPPRGPGFAAALRKVGGGPTMGVKFRRVEFDACELLRWYRRLSDFVWSVPGITMTDIDEVENKIVVGVSDLAQWKQDVLDAASKAKIPGRALRVVEQPPVVQH